MKQLGAEPQVRIIKKKRLAHGGHHGGAWKVAYADFVTAMMALFIVLWIVGQSREVREYVAFYFRDPGAFSESTRGSGVLMGGSLHAPRPAATEAQKELEEQQLAALGQIILDELGKKPELSALLSQVRMEMVQEGMRIELLETSESFFFDIGTATLKPEATIILRTIAREVGTLPNNVIIEGHTDSRPYSTVNGYTNFELSADRANSARRVLATNGLKPGQITQVRGYADSRLRNKENPFDTSNRRISIIIQFQG